MYMHFNREMSVQQCDRGVLMPGAVDCAGSHGYRRGNLHPTVTAGGHHQNTVSLIRARFWLILVILPAIVCASSTTVDLSGLLTECTNIGSTFPPSKYVIHC